MEVQPALNLGLQAGQTIKINLSVNIKDIIISKILVELITFFRVNLETKKEKNQKPKEQVVFFYLRHQVVKILLLSLRPIKSPLRMVSIPKPNPKFQNLYSQMMNLVILDLHLLVINLAGFHFRIP